MNLDTFKVQVPFKPCIHFLLQLTEKENVKAMVTMNESFELKRFTPSEKVFFLFLV